MQYKQVLQKFDFVLHALDEDCFSALYVTSCFPCFSSAFICFPPWSSVVFICFLNALPTGEYENLAC